MAADNNHRYHTHTNKTKTCTHTHTEPWQRDNAEANQTDGGHRWQRDTGSLAHQHVLREAESLALLLESLEQRIHRLLQGRPLRLLLLLELLLNLQLPLVVMSGLAIATAVAVLPLAVILVRQLLHRLLQP